MKAIAILFTSTLLALNAMAADNPKKAARRAAADGAESPRLAAAGGFEQVLTEELRKDFRKQMQASAAKTRANLQEVAKLRLELQESVVDGKADEAFIKSKSEAIARIEAELLAARMSALAKVAPSLTTEQKEKIKSQSEQLRNARSGAGAGGRKPAGPIEPAAPPPPAK